MRKTLQKRSRGVSNRHVVLNREESFWPFDSWDPTDPPPDPGKARPEDPTGDYSGPSIKNYPSVVRTLTGIGKKSNKQTKRK